MDWFEKSKITGRFRNINNIEKARIFEFRDNPTKAEKVLWNVIKNKQLGGLKFRRQHKIGQFIVDFYCHEAELVIEVDGNIHDNRETEDRVRTEWFLNFGLKVLRFGNYDVLNKIEKVKTEIISCARSKKNE